MGICKRILVLSVIQLMPLSAWAISGTPFIINSPEPLSYRQWEFNLYENWDRSRDDISIDAPVLELDYGVLPNMELQLIIPVTHHIERTKSVRRAMLEDDTSLSDSTGLGDVEIDFLYRFIEETETRPQVGVFPFVSFPTGVARRDLGNGRMMGTFPLLFQKSWGAWTTYGGPAYTVNHAPQMKNYWWGSWVLQRKFTEKLICGAELYTSAKVSNVNRSYTLLNLGGTYDITPNFQLFMSVGHSIAGEFHFIGSFGLTWTFGGQDSAEKK